MTLAGDTIDLAKTHLTGYDPMIYCDMTYPEDAILVVDSEGSYFHGQLRSKPPIPPAYKNGVLFGVVTHVKSINPSTG